MATTKTKRQLNTTIDLVDKKFKGYKTYVQYDKLVSKILAGSRRVLKNPESNILDYRREINSLKEML